MCFSDVFGGMAKILGSVQICLPGKIRMKGNRNKCMIVSLLSKGKK